MNWKISPAPGEAQGRQAAPDAPRSRAAAAASRSPEQGVLPFGRRHSVFIGAPRLINYGKKLARWRQECAPEEGENAGQSPKFVAPDSPQLTWDPHPLRPTKPKALLFQARPVGWPP